MPFILYCLFVGAIAGADQLVKYLVVTNIPLYGHVEFLHGILGLTYVRNDGAAFSSFAGMQWLFALIFLIFTGAILWEYFKKPMGFTKFDRICIAAIYGGGLGNMIDRVRLGYVIDMLQTEFMNFPVFNVADCFITCGCIVLVISLGICNKSFWKEERK